MSQFDLKGIGMTSQRTRDRLVKRLRDHGISDQRVLDVIGATPRHIFIDEALSHRAYEDTALPIGHNQTISQPFIVALMTQALLNKPRERVLEIGTGSGYQTAVLAALVKRVYTVERIAPLIDRARERFRALHLRGIRLKYDDGNMGWPEQGPFDGIIVTAAARTVPDALIEQLAVGGRMVIPVGDEASQQLKVIDNTPDGLREESLEYVRFVPLLRGTVKRYRFGWYRSLEAGAMESPYKSPEAQLDLPGSLVNSSGSGKDAVLPDGIRGWSWGAFFLNWIWAVFNRTFIGLLALIPYVGFIMAIVLGVKGREWAWQNKRWESVEHFNAVQRQWSFWGVVLTLGIAGLGIILAIMVPVFVGATQTP